MITAQQRELWEIYRLPLSGWQGLGPCRLSGISLDEGATGFRNIGHHKPQETLKPGSGQREAPEMRLQAGKALGRGWLWGAGTPSEEVCTGRELTGSRRCNSPSTRLRRSEWAAVGGAEGTVVSRELTLCPSDTGHGQGPLEHWGHQTDIT